MENNVWDKFLDEAVREIRDKVVREEVREELFDHLEDRKERFMRFGDSEEEAEKKSLETMGDCVKLKYQLGELHTRCYISDLKAALLEIFIGFLFTFFTVNLFGFDIFKLIGKFCIFAGAYELRNCNSTLKKAWWASLAVALWTCFTHVSKAIPFFVQMDSDLTIAFLAIGNLISVIRTILLFSGIGTLSDCALAGKEIDAPSMTGASIAYVTAQIIGFYFALIAIDDGLQDLGILPVILLLPLFIIILYKLWNIRKAIVFSEYRTESVDIFGRKGYAILTGLIALLVISVVSACLLVATPPIKSEVYVPPEDSAEVNAIRKELIQNGFPEDVANFLPDEEIEKCFPIKKNGRIYASSEQKPITNGPRFYVVAVPLEKEHRVEMRYIQAFKYLDSKDIHGYRDSVITGDDFYPAVGSESYGVFYKENGVLYREEPRTLFKSSFGTLNGMDFRTVKGADEMYGYFAVTGMPSEKYGLKASYAMQIHLWNYPYFSAADILKDGASPYDRQTKLLGRSACRRFTWEIGAPYYDFMFPDDKNANLLFEEIYIENEYTRDKYCKAAFSENGIDNEEHFEVN